MADLPFDMNQADQLLSMGAIDQATYDLAKSKAQPVGPATPDAFTGVENFDAMSGQPAMTNVGYTPSPVNQQNWDTQKAYTMQNADPANRVAPQPVQEVAPVLASDTRQVDGQNYAMTPNDQMAQQFLAPYEMQQAGIAQSLKAAEMRGAETAAFNDRVAKEDMKRIQAQETEAKNRADFMFEKNRELQQKADEVASLSVDPDRYWSNKSTGEKVMAGIGLFLGAFGSNGNQAAKIITNAIDNDINIQKANIDQKSKGLSNKRTLYNDMMDTYKDKDAAMNATRVALINNAQMRLNSIGSRYQGPEAKAKAMQLMGELEAQKNQAAMGFQQAMAKQYQMQTLGTQDPIMQKIQLLPDDLKRRALDELTKAQEYGGFTNEVSKTYKNIMSTGASGVLGSILGGDKEAYNSAKAFLSGAIVGKVPGIKSDSDFENIVVPMLPKPGETMEAATKKSALFDKFLKSQQPGTPVLKGFNLMPVSDENKLDVQKNK